MAVLLKLILHKPKHFTAVVGKVHQLNFIGQIVVAKILVLIFSLNIGGTVEVVESLFDNPLTLAQGKKCVVAILFVLLGLPDLQDDVFVILLVKLYLALVYHLLELHRILNI